MYSSAYKDTCIILTTKHAKSIAVGPPFWNILGASVLEHVVDTDTLGTFSGEIDRKGSALECVRLKCEWSLDCLGENAQYGLGSEGSFGPHPHIPFLPCNHEILYFIDRKRNFHLHISHYSEKTNYLMQSISSWNELQNFASQVQFPSHALILMPDDRNKKHHMIKGIDTMEALERAFYESRKFSPDGKALTRPL